MCAENDEIPRPSSPGVVHDIADPEVGVGLYTAYAGTGNGRWGDIECYNMISQTEKNVK
jgi:hypothetical protein